MFKQLHTERSNHSADVRAAAHQAETHLDHMNTCKISCIQSDICGQLLSMALPLHAFSAP